MPGKVPEPVTLTVTAFPDSEEAARNYLVNAGILRLPSHCPVCSGTAIRHIRRNQCRCRDCRHEWSIRKGSILEGMRISFGTFIAVVRLFANDVPVNEAAHQLGLAYNTVYDIYQRIRRTVLAPRADKKTVPEEAGNSGETGYGDRTHLYRLSDRKKPVVFGIRLNNDQVTIGEVNSPDPAIIIALPVPMMQRGNILFIDAYGKKYQGFITYVPDHHGKDIVRIRVRDGLPWSPLNDFWNFTGKTWTSHRGLDRDSIPEFVQELAFRYNNRQTDLFPLVLHKIAESCTGP